MLAANPADRHQCHYVKAKIIALEYEYSDGKLATLYGPRKITSYDESGQEIKHNEMLLP
ncbi:hypothetical protein SAMN05421690_102137 [Nitrosomonas sp. Nm51]|uniref:hypothetical protein n=1 Tax=Nitrosomonas sp. Nm51 TaxID=133720 RepID=UPI0008B6F582|nr:hypothetical protein [Nitrosomonas sp. Nm51]SER36239.1 hypothetical protein SAMN05421690_102137 [Nitrosomonas sp. Nm51]